MGTADWRLASMSGSLIWVTGKTRSSSQQVPLFSELSPTLIVGFKEQGGSPVEYIKFSSVVSVAHEHPATITLSRKNSLHVSLIAPSSEESFRWFKAVELALSGRRGNSSLTTEYPSLREIQSQQEQEEQQQQQEEEEEEEPLAKLQQPLSTTITRTFRLPENTAPNGVRHDDNILPKSHKTVTLPRNLATDNVRFVREETMVPHDIQSEEEKMSFRLPPRPPNLKEQKHKDKDTEKYAIEENIPPSSSQKSSVERVSLYKPPEPKFRLVDPDYALLEDGIQEGIPYLDRDKRGYDNINFSSSHPSHHGRSSLTPMEHSPRSLQEIPETRLPSVSTGSNTDNDVNDNEPQNMEGERMVQDNPTSLPNSLSSATTATNNTIGVNTTNIDADTGLSKQLEPNQSKVMNEREWNHTLPSTSLVHPKELEEKDEVIKQIERSLAKQELILPSEEDLTGPFLFSQDNTSAIAKDKLGHRNNDIINNGVSSRSNANIRPNMVKPQKETPLRTSILAPSSLELLLDEDDVKDDNKHIVSSSREPSAETFQFDYPGYYGHKVDDVSWDKEDKSQKQEISNKEEIEKKSFDPEKEKSSSYGLYRHSSGKSATSVFGPNKSNVVPREERLHDFLRSGKSKDQIIQQRITTESIIDRIIETPSQRVHKDNIFSSSSSSTPAPIVYVRGIESSLSRKPSTEREDSYLYRPIEAVVAAIPRHNSPHTIRTLRRSRSVDGGFRRSSVSRFSSRDITPLRLPSVRPSSGHVHDKLQRNNGLYDRPRYSGVDKRNTARRSPIREKTMTVNHGRDSHSFIQYAAVEINHHDDELVHQSGSHRVRSRSPSMGTRRKKSEYREKERDESYHQDWAKILMEPRPCKKHAIRSYGGTKHYVFLTGDGMHVVCIPAVVFERQIHMNYSKRNQGVFVSLKEVMSFFGEDCRAMAVERIDHVSLGTSEALTREWHLQRLGPERLVCIVSPTHAFVLEAASNEEAEYLVKAWNAFLLNGQIVY
ncbi:uncharacterized protein TM35_000043110 [Trypanosoma theileri]|uniref:PH domain-containing protein n=1 Tax=Trypanosoma theileri TaxID=67003 RepID=A0A1X0P583_9TRYP|nr:uncharacterized protein TM35_000043110 [Trypanosoma theileri]ORC92097.1 hypothetical protein TM35_000043110 [Trypanosoma theileri]